MSDSSPYPMIEVAIVLIERAGLLLVEFNPRWNTFSLPMTKLRRRAVGECEPAVDAAIRAAAQALGRPLAPRQVPQPLAYDVAPHSYQRSGRDQQTRRYTYRVFGMRVTDTAPRHALGWHTLWMPPDDMRSHRPMSPTALHILQHVNDDPFAI